MVNCYNRRHFTGHHAWLSLNLFPFPAGIVDSRSQLPLQYQPPPPEPCLHEVVARQIPNPFGQGMAVLVVQVWFGAYYASLNYDCHLYNSSTFKGAAPITTCSFDCTKSHLGWIQLLFFCGIRRGTYRQGTTWRQH